MNLELEDELGDIVQKARGRKPWSPADLARAVGMSAAEIGRIESCAWIPDAGALLKIAAALDLHGPSLLAIAQKAWGPGEVTPEPGPFEIVCLDVFMGLYPVKCYLLVCRQTGESSIIDTGGNPEAIIRKVRELNVKPTRILLTHSHPDHAGGLGKLILQFGCPTFMDKKEPRPSGGREFHFLQDEEWIEVGRLKIQALFTPGHTPGGVSFKIGKSVFSGDAIFAGSMGRANASWSGLFQSITRRLLTLPEDTRLYPGHGPATTVGEEKRHNPFFCGKIPVREPASAGLL
ncbi:MAG: hydrolase [Nitrospinae bacterium CG11_big_fil_rev_8_21_14_0_20_56_8]|nr:MAG: hydrolase [Nitrospinae bacterium CG11_big_fil_rev_8_21_14_0_20_56_8]